MKARSNYSSIDPFAAEIVTDPRQIETAVAGCNQPAYERLLTEFEELAQQSPRQRQVARSVLLVLSDAGFGKSHLIGRLFAKLDDDATEIYLRPFQDPSSCWIAILEKVVAELDYPDAPSERVCKPGELTQLDMLARHVLLALVTSLLREGKLAHPNKKAALQLFEEHPNDALDMPGWRTWMNQEQDKIFAAVDSELRMQDLQLTPNRGAWLKVLLAYAYSAGKPDVRQLCLDWLTGRPLDVDEGERLQLRKADLPDAEAPYHQRNERAFERLRDLFALGAFYRPFLLCFDQTELYASSAQLARSLGVVLSRLRREASNQLVVVTSNQTLWDQKLLPQFEEADKHALHPVPIQLSGMTSEHARELVRKRFAQWEVKRDADEFLGQPWFKKLFKRKTEHGVREVLREARKAWRAESAGAIAEPGLDEIFESYRRKLLATPKALDYDPGVLEWAITQVLGPALQAKAEPIQGSKNYLTVQWSDGKRTELFGFESGTHWKRWEAVLREADRYHRDAAAGRDVRSSFLRLPEQRGLPARVTQKLSDGSAYARLIPLDLEQTADVFAAHDFWADVMQENHALDRGEVMKYLRGRLLPLAKNVWTDGPKPITVQPPIPIDLRIQAIVQAKRFITLELLLAELQKHVANVDQTVVLTTARDLPSMRIHTAPGNTVFQWLPQSA